MAISFLSDPRETFGGRDAKGLARPIRLRASPLLQSPAATHDELVPAGSACSRPKAAGISMKCAGLGLLAVSGLEAFFLLVMAGYALPCVIEYLHGSYFLARQAVAWPSAATFVGSNV